MPTWNAILLRDGVDTTLDGFDLVIIIRELASVIESQDAIEKTRDTALFAELTDSGWKAELMGLENTSGKSILDVRTARMQRFSTCRCTSLLSGCDLHRHVQMFTSQPHRS